MPDTMALIDKLIEEYGPIKLINELIEIGTDPEIAERIVRDAMEIGILAAPYRRETVNIIADLQCERARMPRGRAA